MNARPDLHHCVEKYGTLGLNARTWKALKYCPTIGNCHNLVKIPAWPTPCKACQKIHNHFVDCLHYVAF
jgi:hypothetical protein